MEWDDEEGTQESSRGGTRQTRRLGSQRSEPPSEPRKWPEGWPSQKPQEENCRPPQCAAPAPWPQEVIETVIASIRSRFGDGIIGLGDNGIRFSGAGGASLPHARTA
jgi:hypothetical protein